eukprot:Em0008g575a
MSKEYNRLEEGTEMDSRSKELPTKKASRWVRKKFDPYEIPFDEGQKKCASDYDSLDYDTCYNVPYKKQLESYTDFTYWHMSAMKWVLAGLIGVVTGLLAFVVNILRNNLQLLKYTQLRNVLSVTLLEGTAVFGLLVLFGFNLMYALVAVLVIALEPVASGSGVPEIKSYMNGIKLFCAFASTFTLTMLTSAYKGHFGDLDYPGLIGFGDFTHTQKLWEYYHLIVFIIMGAIGGLIGALFNNLYVRIQKYRAQYLLKRPFRRQWSLKASHIQVSENDDINQVKACFCPPYSETGDRMYHNDFATLIFTPLETAITQVYHLEMTYSITTLGLFFLFYYLIFCWSYGAAIAIGFFVPTILIGAIYGRFFGAIFEVNSIPFFSKVITQVYPGTYALIGSAAFVGGVTRMTISLTVLFIESTQQVSFGLPIMVTVMVAKWVGDLFSDGIHNIGISLKKLPYLNREIPEKFDKLTAEDIMSSRVSYLYPITRVRSIEQLLRNTAYSAFPVITPDTFRQFPKTSPTHHLPTCSMYGSVDVTDAEKPHEDLTRSKRPIPRPLSSPGYQRTTFSMHSEADCECAAHIRDSDGLTFTYSIPAPNGLLESMSHDKPLILHGMILRTQLIALLKHRAFFSEDEQPEAQHEVTYDQMMSEYPHYSTTNEVALSDAERNMLMDLTLYMNPNIYTIHYQAPMSQVFTLFRTMGLRHLPVTKASGVLVGVITRHDLVPDKLNFALEEKQKSADI